MFFVIVHFWYLILKQQKKRKSKMDSLTEMLSVIEHAINDGLRKFKAESNSNAILMTIIEQSSYKHNI